MWSEFRHNPQSLVRIVLVVEVATCAGLLVTMVLWGLLTAFGDETGAAAARLVGISGGLGLGLLQILLVHLLALRVSAVKMESESRV